jgi:uncharacterized protein (UPF0332 family)
MTPEERKSYVLFRIETAHKTYRAAIILAENGYSNSAVNRLYYALFYAINALLVLNKIDTKTHSAAKNQFSFHFIKTRELDKKYGKLFSQLFDWRQKGDYDNIFEYSEEAVAPLLFPG